MYAIHVYGEIQVHTSIWGTLHMVCYKELLLATGVELNSAIKKWIMWSIAEWQSQTWLLVMILRRWVFAGSSLQGRETAVVGHMRVLTHTVPASVELTSLAISTLHTGIPNYAHAYQLESYMYIHLTISVTCTNATVHVPRPQVYALFMPVLVVQIGAGSCMCLLAHPLPFLPGTSYWTLTFHGLPTIRIGAPSV